MALRSGDEVGVLYPVDIEREAAVSKEDVAREIRRYMKEENTASINAYTLAKHLVTCAGLGFEPVRRHERIARS